jgi:AcrR family transcriptional regulator
MAGYAPGLVNAPGGYDRMAHLTFDDLKEQEREARKELIVRVTQTLLSEKNFKGVTIRDIAEQVGVSPATLYRYYESLDEIFLAVFYRGTREIADLIRQECTEKDGSSIRQLAEVYIGYLNNNLSYFQMMSLFAPRGMLTDENEKMINPAMKELLELIEGVIERAGYKGDRKLMSHAFFSALNGIMTTYAQNPGMSLEEIHKYTKILAGFIADFFEMGAKRGYY